MQKGVTPASVPPASITSAAPRRMRAAASPMPWLPEAHAVTTHDEGPRRPSSMETCPADMFTIVTGTISGERAIGAALQQVPVVLLEGLARPVAGGHHHPGPLAVALDLEVRVLQRHPRRRHRELAHPVHAPQRPLLDVVLRLEVADLAGDPARVPGGVEAGDRRRRSRCRPARCPTPRATRSRAATPSPAPSPRRARRRSYPQPPVHGETCTRDERRGRRAEERDGPRDVLGVAQAAERGGATAGASRCASVSTSVRRVRMKPGATALTRTPRGPASRARARTSPMIPAFEAA